MKTKMKKILSVLLTVLMLSSMFILTVSASIEYDIRPAGTQIRDFAMLQRCAEANSYANHTGNKDGGVKYALDGVEKNSGAMKWHQNYNGANGQGTMEPPTSSNPVDIKFRFDEKKKITGFVFMMRWDKGDGEDSCGIPQHYEIYAADNKDFNNETLVQSGVMHRWAVSPIMIESGYIETQFIRLVFKDTYGGKHFACSELRVYEEKDFYETQITDFNMLKSNSSANSWAENGGDGGAYLAFNGIISYNERWSQSYMIDKPFGGQKQSGGGQIGGPSDDKPIWIQTGFNNVSRTLTGVKYIGRKDRDATHNECGLPKRYEILVSDRNMTLEEAKTSDSFRVIKSGTLPRQTENEIRFDNPVECKWIRFQILETHEHICACAELQIFEQRNEILVKDHDMLKRNAKTNSSYGGKGGSDDGPVTNAFDGIYLSSNRYHQNYGNGDNGAWNPETGRGGTKEYPFDNAPIWIQTGFDGQTKRISKLKYTSRMDVGADSGGCGIPQRYEIQVSDNPDSGFRSVQKGSLARVHQNEIILKEPVDCKYVRFLSGNTHEGCFACAELELYEVPKYTINLTDSYAKEGNATVTSAFAGTEIKIFGQNTDPSYYRFKNWTLNDGSAACDLVNSNSENTSFIMPYGNVSITANYEHFHTGVLVPGSDADCINKGSKPYYHCECGKNFEDEGCTREIDDVDTWKVIPVDPTGHNLTYVEAVPSTCTVQGTVAHYHCNICTRNFADEAGTEELTDIKAPLVAHQFDGEVAEEKYLAKEATCTEPAEYYYSCSVCGEKGTETFTVGEALGHNMTEYPEKVPTCVEGGNKHYFYCDRCNRYFLDENGNDETTLVDVMLGVDKNNHTGNVTVKNAKKATCTEPGLTGDIFCADCGALIEKSKVIPPLGHDWVYKETVEPTCIKGGYDIYVCANDPTHIEYRNPTEKTGIHTPETVPGKAATCTTDGYTESKVCSVCGAVIEPAKVILSTGHKIVPCEEGVLPTCTTPGRTPGKKCEICGKLIEKPEDIEPLGHKWEKYPGKEPTCTEPGWTEGIRCSRCGKIENSVELPAEGHIYVAEKHEATCTEAGYTVYTCSVCGDTYIEEGEAALGHTGGKATCQGPAICERCGKPYGEKGDHKYVATVVAPTCVHEGYTEYTCEYCGKTYKADYKAKAPHEFDEGVVTKKPTCTQDGEITYHCKNCDASYTEVITAAGHKVENWEIIDGEAHGTCSVCGEEIVTSIEEAGLEVPVCPRCGMRHIYKYGIFKYKGIYCNLVYMLRQIAEFFKNLTF